MLGFHRSGGLQSARKEWVIAEVPRTTAAMTYTKPSTPSKWVMKSFIATGTRHGHGGPCGAWHRSPPSRERLKTDETLKQRVDTRFPMALAARGNFRATPPYKHKADVFRTMPSRYPRSPCDPRPEIRV